MKQYLQYIHNVFSTSLQRPSITLKQRLCVTGWSIFFRSSGRTNKTLRLYISVLLFILPLQITLKSIPHISSLYLWDYIHYVPLSCGKWATPNYVDDHLPFFYFWDYIYYVPLSCGKWEISELNLCCSLYGWMLWTLSTNTRVIRI